MPSTEFQVPIDADKFEEVVEGCAKAIIRHATDHPNEVDHLWRCMVWGITEGVSIGLHLHGRALISAGPLPKLMHNAGPQKAAQYLLDNPLLTFPRETNRFDAHN